MWPALFTVCMLACTWCIAYLFSTRVQVWTDWHLYEKRRARRALKREQDVIEEWISGS